MARIFMRRLGVFLTLFLVAVLATAAACSSSDDDGGATDGGTETPAATDGPAGATDAPDVTEEPDPMDGPDDLPTSLQITAVDNVFKDIQPSQGVFGTIEAPANSEFSVSLFNDGALPHNIAFFDEQGGSILDDGEANGAIILEAETASVTFMTPGPGTYFFNCTVHPLEMLGDFIVK